MYETPRISKYCSILYIEKTFILTYAAPPLGEIFHGYKLYYNSIYPIIGNNQYAGRGHRVSQYKSPANVYFQQASI